MNKRGFTLVELLAVLVVLGIVAVVCYPIVTKTINSSKNDLAVEQRNRVISAAKNYVASNVVEDNSCITVEALKNSGYLESGDIKDPSTGKNLGGGVKVTWSDTNNQYEYKYVDKCA